MDTSEFIGLATDAIIQDLFNGERDNSSMGVQAVWVSKTLKNNKGLFMIKNHPEYYEVTHDGEKDRLYVDIYLKARQKVWDIRGGRLV